LKQKTVKIAPRTPAFQRDHEQQLKKTMEEIGAKTEVCFRVVFADGSSCRTRERTAGRHHPHPQRGAGGACCCSAMSAFSRRTSTAISISRAASRRFRAGMDAGFDGEPISPRQGAALVARVRYSNASIAQAKANARFHYGPGQDFYRECSTSGHGYTAPGSPTDPRRSRKPRSPRWTHVLPQGTAQSSDTFGHIGSGWGNLLLLRLEKTAALGHRINTTTPNRSGNARRDQRRGLEGKIEVLERDFREVPRQSTSCSPSGRSSTRAGSASGGDPRPRRYLKPGGLGVIHFIGHVGVRDTEFLDTQVHLSGG